MSVQKLSLQYDCYRKGGNLSGFNNNGRVESGNLTKQLHKTYDGGQSSLGTVLISLQMNVVYMSNCLERTHSFIEYCFTSLLLCLYKM